ncbi:MAG: GyrI-like domain-containing protein [Oscillospiraceae bacterium]|jgi:AraC family transcriptional regulator|nr:GyrI-like domain-containing protein [Oscillospiraceae bacterium]
MDIIGQLNAAVNYIENNLTGDIDYNEIAKTACSSPYHFQRMFSAITTIPLSEYIRRRRLTRAAMDLQGGDDKIIDIALRYGYNSPDSFTRAFKSMHGITPSYAKTRGVKLKAYPRIIFALTIKGVIAMDYKIIEKDAFKIVGIKEWTSIEGGQNFVNIPQMWQKMPAEKYEQLASLANTDITGIIGVCGEGDEINGFHYWIAAATTLPCPPDLEEREIPASTWAVFESVGPMPKAIQDVWGRIFSEWFPNSGYEHDCAPDFEWYDCGDIQAEDYRSEVWIPVVKKS